VLLFLTLILLLFAGQTVIFLLRIVAADKRDGRHVPLAAQTPTVGELEDAAPADAPAAGEGETAPDPAVPNTDQPGHPGVRE